MAGSLDSTALGGDQSPLSDREVVDADVHVSYGPSVRRQVARYMDRPWRDYVDPDAAPDGYPDHGWPKSLGGARRFNLMDVSGPEDVAGPLVDGFGVDHPIVNVFAPIDKLLKPERALAETSAINDFLLDAFLDEEPDFYGLATISGRDPDAAVEEIARVGDEDRVVGAFFTIGEEFNRPYGDPRYDPVYAALADHDLTPVFHITGLHRKARALRELGQVAGWHACAPAWAAQLTLTSLVFGGVPEKFPELDFVILEGGLGWVPGWLARLNREHGQWRAELPLLERSPERAVRDQVYFGTQPLCEFEDPTHMQWLLEMVGPESLLFSTDHPHYDFDHPRTVEQLLASFDEADRDAVFAGNAREVFGL